MESTAPAITSRAQGLNAEPWPCSSWSPWSPMFQLDLQHLSSSGGAKKAPSSLLQPSLFDQTYMTVDLLSPPPSPNCDTLLQLRQELAARAQQRVPLVILAAPANLFLPLSGKKGGLHRPCRHHRQESGRCHRPMPHAICPASSTHRHSSSPPRHSNQDTVRFYRPIITALDCRCYSPALVRNDPSLRASLTAW